MNLYETISKRKSIRKYELTSLDEHTLNKIATYMSTLRPMYNEIKIQTKIVSEKVIHNLIPIKAPHYIVISSENKEGYLTNIGFIFQQMDLFFSANGIGSCWVGMAKPKKSVIIDGEFEFVIAMAFGKAIEPLYRENILEFKRKSIEQISNKTKGAEFLESARLAPSATNSQPWYFEVGDGVIHAYCVKSNIIKAIVYEKMNKIDMGIAIYHLWLALNHSGKKVEFIYDKVAMDAPPKGYYYISSLKIK